MRDFETFDVYDFAFRNMDEEGVMCRYDALLSFSLEAGGPVNLVYTDLVSGTDGDEATYCSVLSDPQQAERAQFAVEHGSTPKKPPVLDLADIDEELKPLVLDILDEVLAEED